MLEAQRGNVRDEDYPVYGLSGEVCVTHRGDMSEKGIQFLVGVEDAILNEIISRRYRPYVLTACLLVDRLVAMIRQPCRIVSPIRAHCHPSSPSVLVSHP
jgi:hypothetical protein